MIKFPCWTIFYQISLHEKMEIIKHLKNSNSVGWDNIPTNILESNVMTLAAILSNLINKSSARGLFHKSLKRAKIWPIFKSKDKLNIANYRPISILPVTSKVHEKVFCSRLYDSNSHRPPFSWKWTHQSVLLLLQLFLHK